MRNEWVRTAAGMIRREIPVDKARREVQYAERRTKHGTVERVRIEVRK